MPGDLAIRFALILSYSGLTSIALLWLWPVRRANPCFWFLILQWIIAAGTIWLVDLALDSDVTYALLFFLASAAFVCGVLVASWTFDAAWAYNQFFSKPVQPTSIETRSLVIVLVIISIIVTAAYYRAVGNNVLITMLMSQAIGDVTDARLAAYSGDQYFAPGYVNQFKNVILPLCLSIMAILAWQARKRLLFWMVFIAGTSAVALALLGTGQRGAFVYAFLAFLFGLTTIMRFRKAHFFMASCVVVVLFGLMSFALGRIDELGVSAVIGGVLKRVFINDQVSGLIGFRYIYSIDTVWFAEWAQGLLGILPGRSGSGFDHYIFYLMHGTTRGTATPTTVASVYHNGGYLGILCVYLLLGWLYAYAYYRFLTGPRTVYRCFTYGALFFHLAFFVAGAPLSLVNKGVVTLIVMLLIGKLRWARPHVQSGNQAATVV